MNIGIDVRKLRDYGIGTHIRNVILHAAEQDSSNRFYLYCDPRDQVADNGRFVWVPERSGKYSLQEHVSLARKTSKQSIDLYHSPHYTLPMWLKCKSIVTVHDLIHLKFKEYFPRWKVQAATVIIKNALRKADVVITVSKTSKNDILDFFPEAEKKIEVLYNRLSDEWNQTAPMVNLRALGIEKDFLLYVGNFKRHKDIPTLLEAFDKLKDPPQLVLAGSTTGNDSDLYERIFANRRIRLLGFANGPLLRSLYSEAMLFIFPSLYEGFGYPPLEAMACGSPVLSSDTPALKEVLADGAKYFEAGRMESLLEQLKDLIPNGQERSALREIGKRRAAEFQSESSPHRLLEIYKRYSS